jgi:hypothetical protein
MAVKRRRRATALPEGPPNPWLAEWRALTPGQRLVRARRLRKRLRNPEAVHDAKTFPEL